MCVSVSCVCVTALRGGDPTLAAFLFGRPPALREACDHFFSQHTKLELTMTDDDDIIMMTVCLCVGVGVCVCDDHALQFQSERGETFSQ